MQRFAPAEIELEFANGSALFKIPAKLIAQLQELRGYRVTWPDGASGHRPKALGTIFREHMTGEYDPADSREIVRLGLIGGGKDQTSARLLIEDHFDQWPEEEKWKFATAVLVACCQGFQPPPGAPPPKKPKRRSRKTSSSTSPAPPPT